MQDEEKIDFNLLKVSNIMTTYSDNCIIVDPKSPLNRSRELISDKLSKATMKNIRETSKFVINWIKDNLRGTYEQVEAFITLTEKIQEFLDKEENSATKNLYQFYTVLGSDFIPLIELYITKKLYAYECIGTQEYTVIIQQLANNVKGYFEKAIVLKGSSGGQTEKALKSTEALTEKIKEIYDAEGSGKIVDPLDARNNEYKLAMQEVKNSESPLIIVIEVITSQLEKFIIGCNLALEHETCNAYGQRLSASTDPSKWLKQTGVVLREATGLIDQAQKEVIKDEKIFASFKQTTEELYKVIKIICQNEFNQGPFSSFQLLQSFKEIVAQAKNYINKSSQIFPEEILKSQNFLLLIKNFDALDNDISHLQEDHPYKLLHGPLSNNPVEIEIDSVGDIKDTDIPEV
ncbi:MAG: hypothetical protein J0M23_05025 [Rickettsiales bacterium]|nr:hypothetical protein [Rickettsiales bacterium]